MSGILLWAKQRVCHVLVGAPQTSHFMAEEESDLNDVQRIKKKNASESCLPNLFTFPCLAEEMYS